jgi:curved DNA-binding protein CbpA
MFKVCKKLVTDEKEYQSSICNFAVIMHLKDYYSILKLEPSATIPEIKKAYRKLALQFHPDKNQQDTYAAAQFSEIKEAYEVLTNPSKKGYYLQQRWYDQSIGKRKTQDIITPVNVLKQVLELEKYVSTLDVFRMDKEGLQHYILELIPASTIEELKKFNEPDTNREIITTILKAMRPLTQIYTVPIIGQLEKLAGDDEAARTAATNFIKKNAQKSRREKYSLLIIIITTFILCLLIWLAGR